MKAPKPSGAPQGGRSLTQAPAPNTSGGGGSSYLKAEHIAQRGTTALTFLGGAKSSTGQYGAGVDLPVVVGKKKYTFTVKFESGNYPRLYTRFGSNFAKWKGKVKVCVAQHLGKNYVQVVD